MLKEMTSVNGKTSHVRARGDLGLTSDLQALPFLSETQSASLQKRRRLSYNSGDPEEPTLSVILKLDAELQHSGRWVPGIRRGTSSTPGCERVLVKSTEPFSREKLAVIIVLDTEICLLLLGSKVCT